MGDGRFNKAFGDDANDKRSLVMREVLAVLKKHGVEMATVAISSPDKPGDMEMDTWGKGNLLPFLMCAEMSLRETINDFKRDHTQFASPVSSEDVEKIAETLKKALSEMGLKDTKVTYLGQEPSTPKSRMH